MSTTPPTIMRTTCNRDCPDACGIVATVENGRITRIQGDPDHPVTAGFLCERTSRFLDRQYSPERITQPQRRIGDRWQPITWSDALDEIAEKMLAFRRESGPAAILHYRCGGSLGLMKHVTDYFFERFGPVTIKSGDVCSGAGDLAQIEDFGEEDSHDIFDLLQSKTIVLWGKNVYVSNIHLLPILRRAKRAGARLILVDPVRHRTADICDMYVQPRPGGDIALGLGIARFLFENKGIDPAAKAYCDHFADFQALAFRHSLPDWAAQAGISAEELEQLAREYANGPTALLLGWGMQRRSNGSATIRVLDALAAVSGNLGIPGGGASFYFKRRGAFDLSFVQGERVAPRLIPEPLFGEGITAANDPPIRMVWITAGNPVAMLPDSNRIAEALRTREFTVVVDSFMTDSAQCAHLFLPTTTLLEEDDLLGAYGHHYIAESRPVADAPENVKSDYDILRELARRIGLQGEFHVDVATWKTRLLQKVSDLGASLEDLRQGPVRNPLVGTVLFAGKRTAAP